MDISVGNQSGARKNFYEFPNDVGAALVYAGLAQPIVKPAPTPEIKEWSVGHPPSGDATKWILIWANKDGSRFYFTGDPDAYLKNPPVYGGTACPTEVLEQYKRVKNAPVPFVGLTDAQRNAAATQREREKNARQY
jgi:hypothetical protein